MVRPLAGSISRCAPLALVLACGDATVTTGEADGSSTGDESTGDASSTGAPTTTAAPTTDSDPGGTDSEAMTTAGETDTSTGPAGACGDGVVDDGEECDAGDANGPGQACLADCRTNRCGDGDQGPDEACDDGNPLSGDGCNVVCALEVCGDGFVQAGLGEACDDGNTDDGDGCSAACLLEACGDGVVQPGEACDDGNPDDQDGCSADCALEVCGDGVVQEALEEQCDDGNTAAEDGCSPACALEVCGDDVLQAGLGEACDDGNTVDGDGCSADCELEVTSLCPPGEVTVLANEGFEAGVFPPWTSNSNATKVVMSPHSGVWAAETVGNFFVRQDFAAVPVPELTSAEFWTWHDLADAPAMSVEWGYADASQGSTFFGGAQLDGWKNHDILGDLDPTKSLVWLQVWGYAGGGQLPDVVHFDDFRLCRAQ
jgi:cysteine-rich repeat protein